MTVTISQALDQARRQLTASPSPRLDVELLLAGVLERRREYLLTWPQKALSEEQLERFRRQVERRGQGHPVAYLVGRRGFWKFDLKVDPSVLIPRPETELLVELALGHLPAGPASVADLGTGSGAIALALAGERPAWRVIATDFSKDALALARTNAESLDLPNVVFRHGDWCTALAENNLDAIVANPPYISSQDRHLAEGDLRFEPAGALVAAEDGLADIRAIAGQARDRLASGGWLMLEHGWDQGAAVRMLLDSLNYQSVSTQRDLAGHERVTQGRMP